MHGVPSAINSVKFLRCPDMGTDLSFALSTAKAVEHDRGRPGTALIQMSRRTSISQSYMRVSTARTQPFPHQPSETWRGLHFAGLGTAAPDVGHGARGAGLAAVGKAVMLCGLRAKVAGPDPASRCVLSAQQGRASVALYRRHFQCFVTKG